MVVCKQFGFKVGKMCFLFSFFVFFFFFNKNNRLQSSILLKVLIFMSMLRMHWQTLFRFLYSTRLRL